MAITEIPDTEYETVDNRTPQIEVPSGSRHGPWIINKRNIAYESPYGVRVYHDECLRPNGKPGNYYWIKFKEGAAILPIDNNMNAYLTQEFHYARGDNQLEIAGGGLEPGENPLATAKRELKEELGITAATWVSLGTTWPVTGVINSAQHLFMCHDFKVGETKQDSTERIKLVRKPLEQVVDDIMNGRICDQQATCAILKADKYFQNQFGVNYLDAYRNRR